MIWIWLIMTAGLNLVTISMVAETIGFINFLYFRLSAFILGLSCILYGVKEMNWI